VGQALRAHSKRESVGQDWCVPFHATRVLGCQLVKADEEKAVAALASAGITELNYGAARDVAFGEDEDDDDEDADDDEEEDTVDLDDMNAAVEKILQGGARLTSAHIWNLDGGVTADLARALVHQYTLEKVTKKRAADDARKEKADGVADKKKKAVSESIALINRFKADETGSKKTMKLPELKNILLAYNIPVPPGSKKVDLVKLIIDAGLG